MYTSPPSPGKPCWIYVLQDGKKQEYQIGYTIHLSELAEHAGNNGKKLVYAREFNNFADAIGHKLFLEEISAASLKRIVHKYAYMPNGPGHMEKTS
ncbi:MAG: hypothetical protein QM786_09265 [Breznakibacter sp.]